MKDEIKDRILKAIGSIPEEYLSDTVIKETIRCILYGYLEKSGLIPVPAFRNPRYHEGPVDIMGMKDAQTLEVAFCSSPTIELDDIKRLERVPCEKKFVISFSDNQKKVDMSKFFLKPGIEHIYIHDTAG